LANTQTHVGVEVGDGLVARFGDALLLVVEPGQHRERAEDLLAAVEGASTDAETVPTGTAIAHRLAMVVAGYEPGTVPPFGAVARLGEGYVVLLHGPVSAEITSPLGVVQLSGDQAVTWVDYKVEVSLDRLSVTSGDHPVQVDPMSDLRAGLVPGNGFVVTRGRPADQQHGPAGGSQAGAGKARTARNPGATDEAGRPRDAGPRHRSDAQRSPQPATAPAAESAARTAGRAPAVTLEPGPPAGGDVAHGPARPAQRSARATEALGAPVGYLVAADGMRVPLDRAYVLGREPEADPAVKSGAATPVRLADDENLISRVHSYVTVEAGEVSLKDAASANGTFVAAPGDEAWARVGDEPVVLPPAWSMRIGNQVLTYVAAEAAP
jgi:FHA domain